MGASPVVEEDLAVDAVPGVVWYPAEGRPRAIVAFAHGFTVHKRSPFHVPTAEALARRGVVTFALDLPGHGDRQPDGGADVARVDRDWRAHWRAHAAEVIAGEYSAAIDVIRDRWGPLPVGFWGLSLGTQAGVGVVANDDRIRAAVFGLAPLPGPRVAAYVARIRCPVFFVQQLDDELWPAEQTRRLFDAFRGEKELASSPGAHADVPRDVVQRSMGFLVRHLVRE